MIENATLLRIDSPPATVAGGDVAAYTAGAAMSVRCLLDEPTFILRRVIEQLQLESTGVLYVETATMPNAAAVLLRNAQVNVKEDGIAAQLLRIDLVRVMALGGVSHVQCFVRKA